MGSGSGSGLALAHHLARVRLDLTLEQGDGARHLVRVRVGVRARVRVRVDLSLEEGDGARHLGTGKRGDSRGSHALW